MANTVTIPLDSSFAEDPSNQYITGTSSDFTTRFTAPLTLDSNKNYKITCVNAQVPFTFFNVTAAKGNNTFDYSPDGVTWITYVYDDGLYDLTYLFNTFRDEILIPNGWYEPGTADPTLGDPVVYDIEFVPDYPTQKVRINLANGREVGFGVGNTFCTLLGFNPNTQISTSTLGPNFPDVSDGVTTMLLHTSICNGVYSSDTQSDVIAVLPFNAPPLGTVVYSPFIPRYCSYVGGQSLSIIRVYITDQRNRPLSLNSQTMNCEFILQEV